MAIIKPGEMVLLAGGTSDKRLSDKTILIKNKD